MANDGTGKKYDSVAIYRIRKLLSDLSTKTGRGTELVSLYLPPKKPVHEAIAALREESGTASNIKSDTTRNHVQDALTKTMARLRLYKQTPENGIVIFCGAIPGPGGPGNETIELFEVMPQKPVSVYLYRCLAPDTNISLDDGTQTSIGELGQTWERASVLSFDLENNKTAPAKIIRHFSAPLEGRKTYRLKVESGRTISGTEDHPLFTPRGWVKLGDLGVGDLVCVNPVPDLQIGDGRSPERRTISAGATTIVDESILRKVSDPPNNIQLAIRRLKDRGLLPLTTTNPKLRFLARLMGHLLSDGSLTRNVEVRNGRKYTHFTVDLCVGSEEDMEDLRTDLATLGVRLPQHFFSSHLMAFEDRSYISKTVHAKLRDTAIITLLRALGAPIGSKVKNGTEFPEWLSYSPLSVQREFLAAYMGGDGEAPHMVKSNPSSALQLSFHRSDLLGERSQEYARKLARLFENFGVIANDISKTPSKYERKDGLPTSEISLRFQLTEQNVLRLCHAIGYRYCHRKSVFSSLVGEYLRIKFEQRKVILEKMSEVRRLVSSGISVGSSSSSVDVSPNTTAKWLRSNSTNPLIRSYAVPSFLEWRKLAEKNLGDGLVWETVTSKDEVQLEKVMDLTLDNESHTFFANGFLVHNCDDHFHLDPLRDMLREQNEIGVLSVDATEAGLGIVSGDTWDIVDNITSGVSGKTRKGGQSARRYERLREMELTDYFNRLADHAKKTFIDQHPVKGLIVSGPGPTKDEFVKDGYLDYRLQNVIVGTLDTGYAGREGVRETIGKSEKLLENVRVVEERKLVDRFLREINTDTGLAIYGIQDILNSLKRSAVDTIIVNDDVDLVYLKATCRNCGNVIEKFASRAQIVEVKQSLLSCPNCGSNEVDIIERDIVDYLADAALDSGAGVEVISSKTEGGAMLKNFGGISAILRYRG